MLHARSRFDFACVIAQEDHAQRRLRAWAELVDERAACELFGELCVFAGRCFEGGSTHQERAPIRVAAAVELGPAMLGDPRGVLVDGPVAVVVDRVADGVDLRRNARDAGVHHHAVAADHLARVRTPASPAGGHVGFVVLVDRAVAVAVDTVASDVISGREADAPTGVFPVRGLPERGVIELDEHTVHPQGEDDERARDRQSNAELL